MGDHKFKHIAGGIYMADPGFELSDSEIDAVFNDYEVELFVEVLVRRDGCGVVGRGALCCEVLPSQNSGESEMPMLLASGGLWHPASEVAVLTSYRAGSSGH